MRLALVTLSNEGARVVARLAAHWPDCPCFAFETVAGLPAARRFTRVMELTQELFGTFEGLVYVAPAGLVVRAIGPCLQQTGNDPAVVVVDVGARWAVSLLSGRQGGGPDLACAVASVLGAEPVVTTTTEAIKDLVVGVAFRRETSAEGLVAALATAVTEAGCQLQQVRLLAVPEALAGEPALVAAAERLRLPSRAVDVASLPGLVPKAGRSGNRSAKTSPLPEAQWAALLAGSRTRLLLLPPTVIQGISVAIAREEPPAEV